MSFSVYQVIHVACQSSRLGSGASDFVNAKNHAKVCCVVTFRIKPLQQYTLTLSILQHDQNLSFAKKGLIVLFFFLL